MSKGTTWFMLCHSWALILYLLVLRIFQNRFVLPVLFGFGCQASVQYTLAILQANTIAQGTINMNACTEVAHAETLTGQRHSLCIFLPEMKYFIRSENKEDTMGWACLKISFELYIYATATFLLFFIVFMLLLCSWYDALIVYPETAKEEARRKNKLLKKRKSVEASQARAVRLS